MKLIPQQIKGKIKPKALFGIKRGVEGKALREEEEREREKNLPLNLR